jgi:hypothetical protein
MKIAFKSGDSGGHEALPYGLPKGRSVGAGLIPISAQIRMRLCKEKGRHSREGGNPVFLLFLVKSTGNELDPRFCGVTKILILPPINSTTYGLI